MPMSDLMADSDASYLTSDGQSDADQAMVKQYSGNYGQDMKHSLVGTIIGMMPGFGQIAQGLMSDGTGVGASFASGQAAAGGMGNMGYDPVSSKGDSGAAGGSMNNGIMQGGAPGGASAYPFLQMLQNNQFSGQAQTGMDQMSNYGY